MEVRTLLWLFTLSERVALYTCNDGGEVGRRSSCDRGGGRRGCGVDVLSPCRAVDSQRVGDLDCDETTG